MKKILILLILVLISISGFSQSTDNVRQDTIKHIAKDNNTRMYHDNEADVYQVETNKDTFNFNKPITINGLLIGGGVADTANFAYKSDSSIYSDTAGFVVNLPSSDELSNDTDTLKLVNELLLGVDIRAKLQSGTFDSTYFYNTTDNTFTLAYQNSSGSFILENFDRALNIIADQELLLKTNNETVTLEAEGVQLFWDGVNFRTPNDTAWFKSQKLENMDVLGADTIIVGENSLTGGIAFKTAVEASSFSQLNLSDTTITTHSEGRFYYNSATNGIVLDDDIEGKWNLGSEVGARYYNPTASQINDGDIVRLTGSHEVGGVVYGAVELAGNMSEDSTDVLGAATTDITSLGFGRCTFLGQINNINTTGLTGKFYLGNAGQKLNDSPSPPARSVLLGHILKTDATAGAAQLSPQQAIYDPNPTFSALFEEVGETITNPAVDTYAPITNATNDLFIEQRNFGFDFVGDSISPQQDGTYTIFFSYSFYGEASQTDLYRIGTFVDGVKQFSLPRTASGTNTGGVSYPVTLTLTAGQWISFKVKNTTTSTRDCLFDSAVVTINYN